LVDGDSKSYSSFCRTLYANPDSYYNRVMQRVGDFKLSVSKNLIEKQLCEEEFAELIKDYLEYDVIKQMDEHIHHGTTTTLQHCEM